jgi:galactose-1-phosphate uridylyltransferase
MEKDDLIKIIKNDCEYEWDSDVEKEIQDIINHWIDCYPEHIEYGNRIYTDIKNDLWRDILSSIFHIHNQMIIKKINTKENSKVKGVGLK